MKRLLLYGFIALLMGSAGCLLYHQPEASGPTVRPPLATDSTDAAAEAVELRVSVGGIQVERGGQLLVLLFQDSQGFPMDGQAALLMRKLPVTASGTEILLGALPPGEYAAIVFHDANGNGKPDRNLLGMPQEGIGISQLSGKLRRRPSFEEARFAHLPGADPPAIEMRYF